MIGQKFQHDGDFWDVNAQEQAVIAQYDKGIDGVERAIGLAKRMTALSGAAGFDDMLGAIKDLERWTTGLMCAEKDPYETARLQGQVKSYQHVGRLMSDAEARLLELDSQLKMLQDQRSALIRPTVKQE